MEATMHCDHGKYLVASNVESLITDSGDAFVSCSISTTRKEQEYTTAQINLYFDNLDELEILTKDILSQIAKKRLAINPDL